MKVVLAGGSGQHGNVVMRHYAALGYEIIVLTRSSRLLEPGSHFLRSVTWNGKSAGRLIESGYPCLYPDWKSATEELLVRWTVARTHEKEMEAVGKNCQDDAQAAFRSSETLSR